MGRKEQKWQKIRKITKVCAKNCLLICIFILWERTWHCSHCCGWDVLDFSLVALVLFVEEKGIWGVSRGLGDTAANAMWGSLWPRVRKGSYGLQRWHQPACQHSAWEGNRSGVQPSSAVQQRGMRALISQKNPLCLVDSVLMWEIGNWGVSTQILKSLSESGLFWFWLPSRTWRIWKSLSKRLCSSIVTLADERKEIWKCIQCRLDRNMVTV